VGVVSHESVRRWPLLAAAACFALFAVLAVTVDGRRALGWDTAVLDLLARFPVSSSDVHVDPFVTAVTLAAGAVVVAVAVVLLARRRFRASVFLVAGVAGAVLLGMAVKALVERPPIEGAPGDHSFPSGNAAWSMAAAAALALLARSSRRGGAVLAAGVALVLGVGAVIAWEEWHYPSDVVAGWCLALGWVAALWLALRRPSC
jgi:membrane-associated phospholipid phosphatase